VLPPSPAEKAPFHGHLRNHVTFFAQSRNVFAVARSLSGRATVRQPPTRQMHGEGFRKLGFPVCALCCKTRRMSDSNVVIEKSAGDQGPGKIRSCPFGGA